MKPRPYDAAYYHSEGLAASLQSAKIIVPIVMSLVHPRSVVDVGCGSGAWLSVFRENGVDRILGLDGDHVDPSWLTIPRESFRPMDLSGPIHLDDKFDLAVCLEVAEHLPPKYANSLVQSLVALAPIILFSAAIPFQGGVHHVNEQWPEYWHDFFAQNGFQALDVIRKQVWKNSDVAYWYRQNTFLFVQKDLVSANPAFADLAADANDLMLVHRAVLHYQMGVRSILKQLPRSVWDACSRRFRKALE